MFINSFISWIGGKKALRKVIYRLFPKDYGRYIEVFGGGGCTFYSCHPCDVRKTFFLIWEASRRLADTVVENKDFGALIRQYDRDNAFFYVRPAWEKERIRIHGHRVMKVYVSLWFVPATMPS